MVAKTLNENKSNFIVHPSKFTLWLFLITVTMLFGAFTSAMVVQRGDSIVKDMWVGFSFPVYFNLSTFTILASSVTMQLAYYYAKKNEITLNRRMLWATFILGALFLTFQFLGYNALVQNNIYLMSEMIVDDQVFKTTTGSFFYVISGVHALHLVGGIFFILATIYSAYKYRVHSKNMLRINLCTTYWHFIGILWVYLYAILNVYI